MKIIDEKGNFFGTKNVIDLFLLICVLFIILFVGNKLFGERIKEIINNDVIVREATFTVRCTVMNEAIAKGIHPLDKLLASNKENKAYISAVTYSPAFLSSSDKNGRPVYSKDTIKKDVLVTINMQTISKRPLIILGTQQVLLSNTFKITTDTSVYTGIIDELKIKIKK